MHTWVTVVFSMQILHVCLSQADAEPSVDAWVFPGPYNAEDRSAKFDLVAGSITTISYMLAKPVDNLTLSVRSLDDAYRGYIYAISHPFQAVENLFYTWTVTLDEHFNMEREILCQLVLQCVRGDEESAAYSDVFKIWRDGASKSVSASETPSTSSAPRTTTVVTSIYTSSASLSISTTASTDKPPSLTAKPSSAEKLSSSNEKPPSSLLPPFTSLSILPATATSITLASTSLTLYSPPSISSRPTSPTTTHPPASTPPPPPSPPRQPSTKTLKLALGIGLSIGLFLLLLLGILLGLRVLLVRGNAVSTTDGSADLPELARSNVSSHDNAFNDLPELVSVEKGSGVTLPR